MNSHPLQELVVDTFVPNDTYIAGGTHQLDVDGEQGGGPEEVPNVVICTGANACGKVCNAFSPFPYSVSKMLGSQSVYLKQVRLLLVLDHPVY